MSLSGACGRSRLFTKARLLETRKCNNLSSRTGSISAGSHASPSTSAILARRPMSSYTTLQEGSSSRVSTIFTGLIVLGIGVTTYGL